MAGFTPLRTVVGGDEEANSGFQPLHEVNIGQREKRNLVTAALSSGIDDVQGLGYSILGGAADAVGANSARDWANEQARRQQIDSSLNGRPDLERVEDQSLGTALPYAAYQVLKQAPLVGTIMAAEMVPGVGQVATATGLARAGAVAPRFIGGGGLRAGADFAARRAALAQGESLGAESVMGTALGYGSLYGESVEAGDPSPYKSALMAVPYGIAEAAVPAAVRGTLRVPADLAGGTAMRMAKAGGLGMLGEAGTEGFQNEMEMSMHNGNLSPEEMRSRRLNSIVAGGIVGGPLGSLGGIRTTRTVDDGAYDLTQRPSNDVALGNIHGQDQTIPLQQQLAQQFGLDRESVGKGYAKQFETAFNEPSGVRVSDPVTGIERELTVGEALQHQAGLTGAPDIVVNTQQPKAPSIADLDPVDQGLTDVGIQLASGKKTREKQRAFYQAAVDSGIPLDSDLLIPFWKHVADNKFGDKTKVALQNAVVAFKQEQANGTQSAPVAPVGAGSVGAGPVDTGSVGTGGPVADVNGAGGGVAANPGATATQVAPVGDTGVQPTTPVSVVNSQQQGKADPFQVTPEVDDDALEIARMTGNAGALEAVHEENQGLRADAEQVDVADADRVVKERFGASPTADRDAKILTAYMTAMRDAPHGTKMSIQKAIGEQFGVTAERVRQIGNPEELVRAGVKLGFTAGQVREMFGVKDNSKTAKLAGTETKNEDSDERATLKKSVETYNSRIKELTEQREVLRKSADPEAKKKVADLTSQIMDAEAQRDATKKALADASASSQAAEDRTMAKGLSEAGFDTEEGVSGFGDDQSRHWQKESSAGSQDAIKLIALQDQVDQAKVALERFQKQGMTEAAQKLAKQIEDVNAEIAKFNAAFEKKAPEATKPPEVAEARKRWQEAGRDITKLDVADLKVLEPYVRGLGNTKLADEIKFEVAMREPTAEQAAPVEEAKAEPVKEEPKVLTPKEQYTKLTEGFPVPAWDELTKAQQDKLADLAHRDQLNLSAINRFVQAKAEETTTKEQREVAEDHAKDVGGTVAWQEGPLALIRGYSRMTGQPVYAVAKGTARSSVDVESFTGNAITPEEKAKLIEIKKQLEAADAEKHASAPFIQFDENGLAVSSGVDSRLAGVLAGWKKLLNIKSNIYITTIDDARADKDKFTGPHRAIGSAGLNANEAGSMRRMGDGFYIAFKKGTSYLKMLETLGHELGHVHEREAFDNAPAELKKAIRAEHDKFIQSQAGKTGKQFVEALRARAVGRATKGVDNVKAEDLSSYWKSFSEWYADQVSKWATTSEKPVGVVEQFFAKLGAALKKFYYSLKGEKYLPSETMKQFLDSIAARTLVIDGKVVNNDTSSQAILAGVRSFRSKSSEQVAETKARLAIAKQMDAAGDAPEEIWHETGWYKNPVDEKWRFEVPDTGARFVETKKIEKDTDYELGDVLDHEMLYDAYPQLKEYKVVFDGDLPAGHGGFSEDKKRITLSWNDAYNMPVLLHELQHAVQSIEGFSLGGNPDMVMTYDIASLKKLRGSIMETGNVPYGIKPSLLSKLIGILERYDSEATKLEKQSLDAMQRHDGTFDDLRAKMDKVQQTMEKQYDSALNAEGVNLRHMEVALYQLIAGEQEAELVAKRSKTGATNAPINTVSAANQLVNRGNVYAGRVTNVTPEKLKQPVSNLTRVLKTYGSKALNTAMFSQDLFKRAADMGITAAKELGSLYQKRAALTGQIERKVIRIEQMFNRIPEGSRQAANEFVREMRFAKAWGFTPDWRKTGGNVDPALEAKFKRLPEEAQAWAKALFKHGDEMRTMKQDAVRNAFNSVYDARINDAKKAGDNAKVAALEKEKTAELTRFKRLFAADERNPYAPVRRFGNWVVVGKSAEYIAAEEAGDKEKMSKLESDADHYFVDFRENYGEALKLSQDLEASGLTATEPREKEDARNDMYGGLMSAFDKLRGNIESELGNSTDAAERKALRAAREVVVDLYLRSLADTSARKSELRFKGVAGDIDMLRSFSSQGRADAHFLAAATYNPQMTEAITKMRQQKKSAGNATEKSMAFNEIMARHEQSMKYQDGGWFNVANKAAAVTSAWTLATSPMYYLQNLLQPMILSVPYMAGKHKYDAAWGQLTDAYKELGPLLKSAKVGEGFNFSKVPEDVRDAILELVNRGRIDIGMDTELGKVKLEGDSLASKVGNRTSQFFRTIAQKTEAINRVSTAMAAYRLELKRTGDAKAALEYADEVLDKTHGDYTAANAPRLFNTAGGKVALQFRKFQLIQLTLLAKMAHDAFAGASKSERAAARKMLGFTLGHTAALAGVVGMPGFAALAFIVNHLVDFLGGDDEPYDLENELRKSLGGGDFARVVMRGVPMAAGVDLSGKVGMGNALSILPYSDMDMTRAGFNEIATGLTLGATGGLLARQWEALGDIKNGDYYRGLAGLMPKGLADAMRAFHDSTEGMSRRNGDTLLSAEEIGLFDTVAKAIGLPTAKESERRFDQNIVYNTKQAFEHRTTQIKNQYVSARRNGDTEGAQSAMTAWRKLQASRKEAGFDVQPVSTLLKAPMEQKKRDRNVSNGVQYDKHSRRMVLAQTSD